MFPLHKEPHEQKYYCVKQVKVEFVPLCCPYFILQFNSSTGPQFKLLTYSLEQSSS